MKKKERRKMILIGSLLIIGGIVGYLKIPYSPVKKEYCKIIEEFEQDYNLPKHKIEKEDLKPLPPVLQKYFIENGYVGIESANTVIFEFKNVNFSMGIGKSNIKIDYTVHDFTDEPIRVALIDSQMYGIPFQGIDKGKDGVSSMKGIIAKHIPLFNTSSEFIDPSYLAEALMHPSLALQKDIRYKQIDDYSVEATIRKNGREASGIFYFNKDYEMTSFVVQKRWCSDTNTNEKWTVILDDYKITDGINTPTKFQAIWNFKDGDLIYFDSDNMRISSK